MIQRPAAIGSFLFVVVSVLRTKQLVRGSTPKVTAGRRPSITAQMEVAEGKVTGSIPPTLQTAAV